MILNKTDSVYHPQGNLNWMQFYATQSLVTNFGERLCVCGGENPYDHDSFFLSIYICLLALNKTLKAAYESSRKTVMNPLKQ